MGAEEQRKRFLFTILIHHLLLPRISVFLTKLALHLAKDYVLHFPNSL